MEGYIKSLQAVGYEVIDYQHFGSYQGTWFALVRDIDGSLGYIQDEYGSCGGCDAFEGEHINSKDPQQLHDFGMRYKDAIIEYDQALKIAERHNDRADENLTVVDWIKKHEKLFRQESFKKEFDKDINA